MYSILPPKRLYIMPVASIKPRVEYEVILSHMIL